MTDQILHDYWDSRAAVRQVAAQSGQVNLVVRLAWQDVLRRHLDAGRKKLKILDIGTGTGYLPLVAADLGHRFTGIDWSLNMIEVAMQRAEESEVSAEFITATIDSTSLPDARFDCVTGLNIFSLLQQPREVSLELQRILKPGGKLLLIEDDRSADGYLSFERAQSDANSSPQFQAYLQAAETIPFWQAQAEEICTFLELNGWKAVQSQLLAGQLERRGSFEGKQFAVGYRLISAENAA